MNTFQLLQHKYSQLTFVDEVKSGSVSSAGTTAANGGRQLVPGLIYIDDKAPKYKVPTYHVMNDDCGDFSVISLLWYQWQDKVSLWQPTYNNDWLPLLLWLHFINDKTRIAKHLTEFLIACCLRKVSHMFPLLWSSSTLSLPLRKSEFICITINSN